MKHPRLVRILLLVGLFSCACLWLLVMSFQMPQLDFLRPGPAGARAELKLVDGRSQFPSVRLHVLVTDSAGQPIKNLQRGDFSVTEDGTAVEIKGFSGAGEQAVTAILVIDRSGSMGDENKIVGAKAAAQRYVEMMRPGQDRTGLIAFSDSVTTLDPLTDDKARLLAHIDSIYPQGSTAYYDAVYEAIRQLSGAEGRTVVIALTDGQNNVGVRSMSQVIQYANDNHAPLYTIGLGTWDIDRGGLERMARETGGEYHHAPSADQLTALYQKIAQGLQNEYVLTYNSPTPRQDGSLRQVAVTVRAPGGALDAAGSYTPSGVASLALRWELWLCAPLVLLLLVLLALLPTGYRWVRGRWAGPATPAPEALSPYPAPAPPPQPYPVSPPAAPIYPQPAPLAGPLTPASAPPAPPPVAPISPQPAPPQPPAYGPGPTTAAPASLVQTFPLPGPDVTVGRDAQVRLPDSALAPQHARFCLEGSRWVVYDLGAPAGVYVSFAGAAGREVRVPPQGKNALKDGSTVRLGRVVYTFRQPASGAPTLETRYALAQPVVTIGRDASNDIVLDDESVSRRHAEIRQEAGRYVVYDRASANSTFVSFGGDPGQEKPVTRNALKDGSTVRLGKVRFVFRA